MTMSKEYIERKAICENCNNKDSCFPYPEMRVKCPVYKTPVADVAPVVHGEWIPIVNYFNGKPDGRYYCSVCRRVEDVKGIYCRVCGARMKGVHKDAKTT